MMSADSHSAMDHSLSDDQAMLVAVYRAAERVTAELDLTRALEEIIACVRNPLGLDRAGVFLYQRGRGVLVRLIGVGHDGRLEYGPDRPIPMSDRRGPMQRVALGEIPYFHSHDVREDVPTEVEMPPELTAHVIVPLINRGEIIGVMAVDNVPSGRDIDESRIHPLRLFAHFAALALGNALRAQDLWDLNLRLRRLSEISGAFSAILRPEPLLKHMLAELPGLLRANRYSAWRRAGEEWECVVSRRLSPEYLAAAADLYRRKGNPESTMERLFKEGEPIFIAEVGAVTFRPHYAVAIEREGFCSLLGIPLCHGEELSGCVNLYYDEAPDLTVQDWEIARLFARHAGTALRNAELFAMRTQLDEELRRVNEQLESDRRLLLNRQEELRAGEAQKKQFYRDVLFSMTNGKIMLCDHEEIAQMWGPDDPDVMISMAQDVKSCRDYVQEQARSLGMAEERIHELCLCTSEAATNALKHAGGGWMSVQQCGGMLRVRVTDHGGGIDAQQLPRATLMRGYSTRRSMGLGFTLIHEMADRLCLATTTAGTTLIVEMALEPEAEIDQALAMVSSVEL